MKQLTEAQLLRVLRRAYIAGWVESRKFEKIVTEYMPSELTALCHEQDLKRDALLQQFADQA